LADYRAQGQEFDLFIIQGTSPQDARDMLDQYLDSQRKAGQLPKKTPLGYQVKDRYSHNIYVALSGDMLLGVMRVEDGFEGLGEKYLGWLVQSVTK